MKEIVALLWLVCIGVVSIYLHANDTISKSSLGLLCAFAILGGLAIANYDAARRLRSPAPDNGAAREEIESIKERALAEIRREATEQKNAIQLLVSTANSLQDKLKVQQAVAERLLSRNSSLGNTAAEASPGMEALRNEMLNVQKESKTACQSTREVALILTRIAWFQAATRNQAGTHQYALAAQKIAKELDRLVTCIIPDPQERSAFIQALTSEMAHEKK